MTRDGAAALSHTLSIVGRLGRRRVHRAKTDAISAREIFLFLLLSGLGHVTLRRIGGEGEGGKKKRGEVGERKIIFRDRGDPFNNRSRNFLLIQTDERRSTLEEW